MGSFGALVALPSPLRCSGLHSCSWEGRFSRVHVVTLDKSLNYSGLSFLIVPPPPRTHGNGSSWAKDPVQIKFKLQ